MRDEISVGDWVRYYFDGRFVIGVVEYIATEDVSGRVLLCTDAGRVSVDDVLEVRIAVRNA